MAKLVNLCNYFYLIDHNRYVLILVLTDNQYAALPSLTVTRSRSSESRASRSSSPRLRSRYYITLVAMPAQTTLVSWLIATNIDAAFPHGIARLVR